MIRSSHYGNINYRLIKLSILLTIIFYVITRRRYHWSNDLKRSGYILYRVENKTYTKKLTVKGGNLSRLIDLSDFNFTINTLICNVTSPVLLTLVHSHPFHTENRKYIRETWGSINNDNFKLMFLVGLPSNAIIQSSLNLENDLYADIIQGNFIDAYRNLTYKHVMGLKWSSFFCPDVKYVLKTDDDVFVNTPALMNYIYSNFSKFGAERLIFCDIVTDAIARRSFRSKWRVTRKEYNERYYPTYCNGYAVLYSSDVVLRLYTAAQVSEYFWIDDVHITGILAARENLGHVPFHEHIISRDKVENWLKYDVKPENFLFGPLDLSIEMMYQMWNDLELVEFKTDS